eukprot:4336531-Prymnesium_polylepis.1
MARGQAAAMRSRRFGLHGRPHLVRGLEAVVGSAAFDALKRTAALVQTKGNCASNRKLQQSTSRHTQAIGSPSRAACEQHMSRMIVRQASQDVLGCACCGFPRSMKLS